MKCQFVINDSIVLKGTPISTKLIHPDIIVQLKNAGWDGSTVYIHFDTLYFIATFINERVGKCFEKIYCN